MAEFTVTPADYLPGGRLYGKPNIVVVSPEGSKPIVDKDTGIAWTPGSTAIEVTQTGQGFQSLPQQLRELIGPNADWEKVQGNPFASAQGYGLASTGELIIQTEPGKFLTLGGNFTRDASGNIVRRMSGFTTTSNNADAVAGDTTLSTVFTGATTPPGTSIDPNKIARQSAYDFLFEQFSRYGLGSLVEEIKGLVESNVNPSEFAIRLRQTPTYKRRFAANDSRIKNGLRALSEGEYIALEDQYQNILRNYGLPATYYSRDDIGRQEGFERFISGDVSPAELEDRIQLGINRVRNAAPEVEQTLRQFYPGITQSDILAYTLDPDRALTEIQRKVQAAEIGAEARRAGLSTMATRAEELQRYGVTKEAAQQGFQTIAEVLPRGSQLAEIYGQAPYTQQVAEQEVFALPGAAAASRQRRRLTELEQASFAGQAGTTGGALGRERAGQF